MSLLCRSSWILPFSKGSTSLTTEGTYNQSFVPLGSIGPSVGVSFVFLPSFLPSFIHAFTLPGTKMSLFCRSSWIPPFSKVSTSLTKEGTSINQSFVLGSFGLSVIILFVFLPSFIQVGTKISLFCRSSWIPPFSKGSTSLTKQGRSTNHSINHSLWARSVSQSVVCSSSYHPSFLHSFNWEPRCPCFAGAVEFFLLVRVQLLLQRKAHQSIKRSMNEWINQSMDQSIDKSKPKRVLPIILRTAEECFFLKPFLRKRPSKRL